MGFWMKNNGSSKVKNTINKYKLLNTYILGWDTIHYIYNSFIGKILIFLGVLSIILNFQVISDSYLKSVFFLSLSILIFIISYVIYLIFIPKVIRAFTRYEYYTHIINRKEKNNISMVTEFYFLTEVDLSKLPIYIDNVDRINNINEIDDFIKQNKDGYYQLAQIKFDYLNNSLIIPRGIITILVIVFFITFYFVTVEKLINYISKMI